jgi:protein-disulfide isomerase
MKNKPVLLAMIAVGLAGIAVGALAVLVFRPALLDDRIAEATVRETLRANPEIVLEALQALQTRRADAKLEQQRAAIATNRAALLDDPNSFVAGNPQGDVTVVEFFDYRCPYCRKSLVTVRDLLESDPNVRLVYKEFPILGPQSVIAARVAVAARKDPRYEALHDALMTAPSPLDEEASLQIAAKLGFDRNALAAAMKAPEIDAILKANHALAASLGIAGTPAFVVGDTLVPGAVPLADLKSLVAKVRARGGDRAFARSDG